MKLWRRAMNLILRRRQVANAEIPPTHQVVREAQETRRDLHELRRLEVIVRRK